MAEIKTTDNSKNTLFIFAAVFAVIGIALLFRSFASDANNVSLDVESASLANGATIVNDNAALNSKAIRLASAGNVPSGWPSPNDFKVCGNSSILDGPTSAPSGAVIINPGDDLAAATSNSSSGTTFYLTAGTHTLPNNPVNPKSGNSYIGAPGAILDGQYKTNYTSGSRTMSMAFKGSWAYSDITIKNLTIRNFGQADGKMSDMINQTAINWGQSPGWTVEGNTIANNGGSGIWATTNSRIINNCIENNEQLGLAAPSKGGSDYTQHTNILIEGNEIRGNNRSGQIENVGVCSGCAGALKIWNSKGVTIRNNNVNNNVGTGIWIDNNNVDILIEGNVSKDNKKRGIFYEISYGGIIRNNYVTGNYVDSKGGSNNTAIYVSESGGDQAVKNYLGGTFPAELDINNNYVVDNWNGVSLWESAARYCTSNDTSWCPPLVQGRNGSEKNDSLCSNNLSANADICRWKTQNVKVHDNVFEMTGDASSWCSPSNSGCAKIGIWANTGPSGTPYAGNAVREDITKNQNNEFDNNTYIGEFHNFIYDGSGISRSEWQNTWGQDQNSQFIDTVNSPCQVLSSNPSSATFSNVDLGSGDYKLWARIKNSSTAGKVKIIVDGSKCADITPDSQSNSYQWISTDQVIDSIGSGSHEIKIVALDNNIQIDSALVVSELSGCVPSGDGTNCVDGSNPPPPPPVATCPAYQFYGQTSGVSGISEASGLIESRNQPGVFWTHNDSGGTNEIFAIDSNGKLLSRHALNGANNQDWEDISFGPGPDASKDYIYVGDVGDNGRSRSNARIYRVPEPTVNMSDNDARYSVSSSQLTTVPITYRLAGGSVHRPDVEAFSVDPTNGDIYLVDKGINNRNIPGYNGTSYVFKINGSNVSTSNNDANEVANPIINVASNHSSGLPVGPIGSDISDDGSMFAIKNYEEIFVWFKDGASSFDAALNGPNNGIAPCVYNSSDIDGGSIPLAESLALSPTTQFLSMMNEGGSQPIRTLENTDYDGTPPPPPPPPDPGALTPPTNIQVDPGDGRVVLSWTASSDSRVDEYTTRYREVGTTDWQYGGRQTQTSQTFTGLTNGVEYEFRLRAVDNDVSNTDPYYYSDFVPSPYIKATPQASTPQITPGDTDDDNDVDIADLSKLLSDWDPRGDSPGSPADFNNDGKVDVVDLSVLLSNYGN